MTANALFALIAIPAVAGVLALALTGKSKGPREAVALIATLANLILTAALFSKQITYSVPWAGGFGFAFALRLYHFSGFILLAVAGFSFLVSLYSVAFMSG